MEKEIKQILSVYRRYKDTPLTISVAPMYCADSWDAIKNFAEKYAAIPEAEKTV